MKTIAFFEPRCKGVTHLSVTVSMIKIFHNMFNNHNIIFFAEKEHGDLIQNELPFAIKLIDITPPGDAGKKNALNNYYRDFKHYQMIKKYNPEYLVCLSVTLSTLLFAKTCFKNTKVIITFHSLESNYGNSFKLYQSNFWFWHVIKIKKNNVMQLVYGDSIRDELQKYHPKAEFKSIDHPYQSQTQNKFSASNFQNPVFGAWGGNINNGEGIMFLFQLEAILQNAGIENYEIRHKHALDEGIAGPPAGSKIKFIGGTEPLPFEQLSLFLEEIDYCIFLYPPGSYRFTASGGLLEVLSHLKPVIAFKTPYFEYVFKKMGDIGWLCETAAEISEIVIRIIAGTETEHYLRQQENIIQGMKLFSMEHITEDMRKILNEAGWLK